MTRKTAIWTTIDKRKPLKGKAPALGRRLDVALADQLSISRERAQALILAGEVRVNGTPQHKAGFNVPAAASIVVQASDRFVSRGGYKLEKALRDFDWSPRNLRCLDVGASTGGFTDCLLQHGAASVVSVDVGYGHIAWSLRQDSRVSVVERCNFRYADLPNLGAPFAFVTADVSFISLDKLATQLCLSLASAGKLIALVKPQFEAGRSAVQKGGVVRDPAIQTRAIGDVTQKFFQAGIEISKLTYSPLKGPAGNIEFLIGAQPVSPGANALDALLQKLDVAGVVRKAHEALD